MRTARRTLRGEAVVSHALTLVIKAFEGTNLCVLIARLLVLEGQIDLAHGPLVSSLDDILEPSDFRLKAIDLSRKVVDEWEQIAHLDRLNLGCLVPHGSGWGTFLDLLLNHVNPSHLLVQVGFEAEDVVLQRFHQGFKGCERERVDDSARGTLSK